MNATQIRNDTQLVEAHWKEYSELLGRLLLQREEEIKELHYEVMTLKKEICWLITGFRPD